MSVRSGARDSMPGMLETILDLGLNDASVVGLAAQTGNEHFAWDSYRRFVQMFGNVVRGVPGESYEAILRAARHRAGVRDDREFSVSQLQDVTLRFWALYETAHRRDLPAGPAGAAAARDPRRLRLLARRSRGRVPPHQPHPRRLGDGGQRPADGVRQPGAGSATGVAFSRDEVTGAPEPSGDFLLDAQGEDVVSGVRTPRPLHELADELPEAYARLLEILRELEAHYGDMQDTEFTIERGRLYMLQTRSAKRPAQAAVRFAVDVPGTRGRTCGRRR